MRSALLFVSWLACCATTRPAGVPGEQEPWRLSLPDLDGHELELASLRGRVVLVDFFASWCEPCRASLPFYAELERRYPDTLVVVPVSVDEDEGALRDFLAELGLSMRVLRDPSGDAALAFAVRAMPTMFMLDGRGRIRFRHESFALSDRAEIDVWVRRLCAEARGLRTHAHRGHSRSG